MRTCWALWTRCALRPSRTRLTLWTLRALRAYERVSYTVLIEVLWAISVV